MGGEGWCIVTAWTPEARAAVRAVAKAERNLAKSERKLTEFCSLSRLEHAERERLRQMEDDSLAVRQLNSRPATSADMERVERLATLDKSIPACTAAIAIQQGEVAAATADLRTAKAALAAPVLAMACEMQNGAIEGIRAALSQLAPHYAEFIAAHQVVRATLGDRFPVPTGSTVPMGGMTIVERNLKPIPVRLRPDELTLSALAEAAGNISGEIIAALNQKEN